MVFNAAFISQIIANPATDLTSHDMKGCHAPATPGTNK